jgi:type II secretory pathway component PulM
MSSYLDNLRPFEKRMVVGVVALLFIVLNFWFVVPHFSDWGRAQIRKGNARKALEKFETEINQVPTYTRMVKDLESEGAAVPLEDAAIHFSTAIQEQQSKSGVNITRTGRQTTRTNQFFLEQTQPISVQSKEPQLVDFLYNLGSGNSLIRVRAITLRPDQPRHELSAEITLVASFQKNPTTKSAAAPVQAAAAKSASSTAKQGPAKPAAPTSKSTMVADRPPIATNKPASLKIKRP